ncbi:MAG: hypothetical protein L6R40_007176 [Gallowayella cf. fulva]|nr:MAG: hypothetical protein L6R40_007176 [Xanthomendoza cf. fulva]
MHLVKLRVNTYWIQEAQQGRILLPDDDPDAVNRMLTYLYTSKYADVDETDTEVPIDSGPSYEDVKSLSLTTDRKATADGGNSPASDMSSNASRDLKELANAPVHVMLSALLNNVLVYALADKYYIQLLKELSRDKFEIRAADEWGVEEIVAVLPRIYTTTPASDRGLRDVIITVCLPHMDQLMEDENFRDIMHGDAAMCFDLLSAVQLNSHPVSQQTTSMQYVAEKYEDMRIWVAKEERLLKDLVFQSAVCRNCSRPLHLSISNGSAGNWRQPIIIKCQACKYKAHKNTQIRMLDTALIGL